MNVGMILGAITLQESVGVDPLGSGVPVFSASRNAFADTTGTPSGHQLGKRKTRKEVKFQNYTFTTPPLLGPSTLQLERTATYQHSGSDGAASPNSTITRGIKETEAIKEDFGRSLAQLKQVHAKLTQENSDHAQRAEALMKKMEELRRGLINIKIEGRISQDKLELSIVSINDLYRQREGLTEKRMSEMTTILAKRIQQVDERLKLMSETMPHRDSDVDKRMVDLMTTVQGFTPGVKAVVATVPSRPSPLPVALNPENASFTSASPPQQPTYKEEVQRQSGTKPDQTKQPKLQPPATYKRIPVKAQVATASHTELQRCEISAPFIRSVC